MLADMPTYAQRDQVIRSLFNAVANELERIDDYLFNMREQALPLFSSDRFLTYWEDFLGLPVNPEGVTIERRRSTIAAAVQKRTGAGAGRGWSSLLSAVISPATFRHAENTDLGGGYAPYELALTGVTVQLRATTQVNGTQTSLPSTDATLTVDSTDGFALSGTIYVGGVEVFFSGKTATTFTGVNGLSGTVSDDTAVVQRADYRAGVFYDLARKITPAHLKISEIEIAGDDTFRVGISEVGDEI